MCGRKPLDCWQALHSGSLSSEEGVPLLDLEPDSPSDDQPLEPKFAVRGCPPITLSETETKVKSDGAKDEPGISSTVASPLHSQSELPRTDVLPPASLASELPEADWDLSLSPELSFSEEADLPLPCADETDSLSRDEKRSIDEDKEIAVRMKLKHSANVRLANCLESATNPTLKKAMPPVNARAQGAMTAVPRGRFKCTRCSEMVRGQVLIRHAARHLQLPSLACRACKYSSYSWGDTSAMKNHCLVVHNIINARVGKHFVDCRPGVSCQVRAERMACFPDIKIGQSFGTFRMRTMR